MTKPSTRNQRRGSTVARLTFVIELLLSELERGIDDPDIVTSTAWKKLFGEKDSIVTQVQKLAATLKSLREEPAKQNKAKKLPQEEVPLSEEEMRLLTAWLADGQKK